MIAHEAATVSTATLIHDWKIKPSVWFYRIAIRISLNLPIVLTAKEKDELVFEVRQAEGGSHIEVGFGLRNLGCLATLKILKQEPLILLYVFIRRVDV